MKTIDYHPRVSRVIDDDEHQSMEKVDINRFTLLRRVVPRHNNGFFYFLLQKSQFSWASEDSVEVQVFPCWFSRTCPDLTHSLLAKPRLFQFPLKRDPIALFLVENIFFVAPFSFGFCTLPDGTIVRFWLHVVPLIVEQRFINLYVTKERIEIEVIYLSVWILNIRR